MRMPSACPVRPQKVSNLSGRIWQDSGSSVAFWYETQWYSIGYTSFNSFHTSVQFSSTPGWISKRSYVTDVLIMYASIWFRDPGLLDNSFRHSGPVYERFCASGWHLSLWSNLSLWPFFADPRSPFVFSRDASPGHKLRHETFRQLRDTTVDLVRQCSSAWRPASQCHLVSPRLVGLPPWLEYLKIKAHLHSANIFKESIVIW